MNFNITERTIEFDKLKEIWKSFALTQAAKELITETIPYLSEAEVKKRLKETTESKVMLEKCGNPPLAALDEIRLIVSMSLKGDCLSVGNLLQVESALIAISRMKSYMQRGKSYDIPLAYYEENIVALDDIREAIAVTIVNESVSDSATRLLKDLRYEISLAEDKMKEKAETAIRKYKEYTSDAFTTMRNGHICIPVKKEYKHKITGTIVDKSASGSTLFIEPAASAKYYEELLALRIAEENEVHRILYELTSMVGENSEIILNDIKILEKLDFIFSKGKLSLEFDANEPVICQARGIYLTSARHPLMSKEICVPLDINIGNYIFDAALDSDIVSDSNTIMNSDTIKDSNNKPHNNKLSKQEYNTGIVITGPNTGGKTVALKTVVLNLIMGQCGLHVTCKKAVMCLHSNFLCDIGDGQNMSENLSTFSAHIKNVMNILKAVNDQSFVIMDELGSGTDPQEGMGIAIAILEELKKSGAFFMVTTHYPEVKVYAKETKGLINARMAFDKENLKPLYKLEIGESGESCAFYIASRLGMPYSMIKRAAKEVYGTDYDISDICENTETNLSKEHSPRILKEKKVKAKKQINFNLGDSVMVYPDRKIGIVCKKADDKGVLQVQLKGKKIWINHKRVKLHVAASELYPEDYDFSIIFETVENRKLRHEMDRKFVEGAQIIVE